MLNNKFARIGISILITLAIGLVVFYFSLPALSIHSAASLAFFAGLVGVYFLISTVLGGVANKRQGGEGLTRIEIGPNLKVCLAIVGALLVTWLVGSVLSMRLFRASAYQKMLAVEEGDFINDVEEINFSQIPMLDKDSAIRLGDKKMGELSELVSQFEVNDMYSQINYNSSPVRATYLEYGDIIKWWNNRKQGLPAYIMIDMVTQEATAVQLQEGMKYSPADHFGRNLKRHIRFRYPTFIFAEESLELDDSGHPYWVCPKIKFTIGLFGGRDIDGIVLVDAVTGDCTYYPIDEVPQWIDRAYSADLLIEQFDNYGMLRHGYLNTIFGQRDALTSTQGYNYIAMNDDIYIYTGATSVVSDQSNVGFVLINQRTKDAKFYSIPGATEYSAMASAQGQVQEKKYTATFPLLLNIANEPTYFLALKDEAGLVKTYAMVNVEQYQIVAIGATAQECEKDYKRQLADKGMGISDNAGSETVTGRVRGIKSAVRDGTTYFYISLDNSDLTFVSSITNFEEIVTYNDGDTLEIEYMPAENTQIINIINVKLVSRAEAVSPSLPAETGAPTEVPAPDMSPEPGVDSNGGSESEPPSDGAEPLQPASPDPTAMQLE